MSEKKRKRREDGSERPKKKKALAPGAGRETVQVEVLDNSDGLGPVLGVPAAWTQLS